MGINLSHSDLETILQLYEEKEHYNEIIRLPAINYESALKVLVPVLRKNTDKSAAKNKNDIFKIGWSISKNTKLRGSIIDRVVKE